MKNKVQFIILLLFGLAFLVYLFPFVFVEAAKLESGVTINEAAPSETEKICDDTIDNDNDGQIDGDDQDCADGPKRPPAEIAEICGNGDDQDCVVAPADPAAEICGNGNDDNNNNKIDEDPCVRTLSPVSRCGLQIASGVPINYGEAILEGNNPAWISPNQEVIIKNVGTVDGNVVIKGGNWVSDAAGNPTVSGPDITHVAVAPIDYVETDDPFANPANYEGKPHLENNGHGLNLGILAPEKEIYRDMILMFQIQLAPLMLDGGSFHQEVTIDLIC
jgi:hypothetical protein